MKSQGMGERMANGCRNIYTVQKFLNMCGEGTEDKKNSSAKSSLRERRASRGRVP